MVTLLTVFSLTLVDSINDVMKYIGISCEITKIGSAVESMSSYSSIMNDKLSNKTLSFHAFPAMGTISRTYSEWLSLHICTILNDVAVEFYSILTALFRKVITLLVFGDDIV